jgi:hypothetical protein
MNFIQSRGAERSDTFARVDLTLLVALVSLVVSRSVAWRCFPIFDDAFITLRYGSNLANGHGFVFNSGDWVMGTTSPLFGLIAAGVSLLHLNPVDFFPAFNIIFDGILIILVRCYVFPDRNVAFATFWVLFCASPMLARVTVGAMEVNLFCAALLSTLILYCHGYKKTAAAVGAVSYFIRPEAFLTVALLCLWELLSERKLRHAIVMGLIALAVVVPVLAVFSLVYGGFLPQSVVAKGGMTGFRPLLEIRQLLAPEPVSAFAAILAFMSLPEAFRHDRIGGLLATWFLLYVVAYVASGAHIWSWYSFAPLFCAAVLSGYGVSAVVERVPVLRSWFAPTVQWFALAAVVVVWVGIGLTQPADQETTHIYRPLRDYCRQHLTAKDTTLAFAIGAVAHNCPGFIYDADGLVWPQARRYGSVWKVIEAEKPDYLFLDVNRGMLATMAVAPFSKEYQPVMRFAKDGITDPRQARNLTDTWAPEYMLYRRKSLQ